jgi:histone-lysine N-methyltransferase SETD1
VLEQYPGGVPHENPLTLTDFLEEDPTYQALLAAVPLHTTGCARTESRYRGRVSPEIKQGFRALENYVSSLLTGNATGMTATAETGDANQNEKSIRYYRRAQQRALAMSLEGVRSDALSFDLHNSRQKQVKFARSNIHKYGVVALQPIRSGDFIIQYVGEIVRKQVSALREKRYEAAGEDSSYLFRLDEEYVIDATYQGSIARFINHSCNPNCKSETKSEHGQIKAVAIHDLRDIMPGEELTFDYKFDYEEDRSKAIKCLCGAPNKPPDHYMN